MFLRGAKGGGGEGREEGFDGEMMAPLRDGDPPVFMNEPSPAGWSVMALRTNLRTDGESSPAAPSSRRACLPVQAEMHVNISPWYTGNDAIVTHKA